MTIPMTLPPSHQPVAVDPFLQYSQKGLFAAPWLGQPDPIELMAVQRLSRSLSHSPAATAPDDWSPVMGHLLEVRACCLQAAQTANPLTARARYMEALQACETALNLLHDAMESTEGALANWALGVHTLIRAQLAMPDLNDSERLAREATEQLTRVEDPLCAGAAEDAHAATLLAREPLELTLRLAGLPSRMSDKIEYFRYMRDEAETMLNSQLERVVEAHTAAFRSVLIWTAINLVLMASLPLNGFLRPDIPWSAPLAIAVPILWWLTWDRPYREDMRFFDWIRWIRDQSLLQFHAAAKSVKNPGEQFRERAVDLLREARRDRERLAAFYLFAVPSQVDTVDDAARLADEGKEVLTGVWMIELDDTNPWPLDEALKVQPSMLPKGFRIYYGAGNLH
jgi:hypothetical protein